jgi:hypothetical protein
MISVTLEVICFEIMCETMEGRKSFQVDLRGHVEGVAAMTSGRELLL